MVKKAAEDVRSKWRQLKSETSSLAHEKEAGLSDGKTYRINELGIQMSIRVDEPGRGLLVSPIDPSSKLQVTKPGDGVLIQGVGREVIDEPDEAAGTIGPEFTRTVQPATAKTPEITVDLTEARDRPGDELEIFFGHERGKHWRAHFQLDKLEETDAKIIIVIPEETMAFDATFFFGLLGQSVRILGREDFSKKYGFKCTPEIKEQVDLGIEQSMYSYNFAPGLM